jgi:hypothetical protein
MNLLAPLWLPVPTIRELARRVHSVESRIKTALDSLEDDEYIERDRDADGKSILAADNATSADQWNTVTLATLHGAVIKAAADAPRIDNATAPACAIAGAAHLSQGSQPRRGDRRMNSKLGAAVQDHG